MPFYFQSFWQVIPRYRPSVGAHGTRWFSVSALLLAMLCGCGSETQTPPPTPPPVTPPAAVTPDAPSMHRVVAFAPSLVEYIFAMHEQNRLVGVSDWCDFPPEAKQLPVLGSAIQPDLERIVATKPDLILGIGKSEKLVELAAGNAPDHPMRVEALRIESLDDIVAAPLKIATLMGVPERGKPLHDKLEAELAAVKMIAARATSRPRVLVFTGDGDARFTIGKGSFLTDLVTLCGGDSVTGDLAQLWPTIGMEDLSKANPDVILMLQSREDSEVTAADRQALIDRWKDYPDFPAVKNHRILVLTGTHLLKGGPRITLTAQAFLQAIHPELMPKAIPPTEPHP